VKQTLRDLASWLTTESQRFEYREGQVFATFSLAATCLIDRFPMMDSLYKNALQQTFITDEFGGEKLYCIKWYQEQDEFSRRITRLGDNTVKAQEAKAFTVTWSSTDEFLCVTEHEQRNAPFNRGIEFHEVDKGSFTHELLHWCTHEDFKNHIEARFARPGPHYDFFKEALTEWLKRYATNDPNTGGYQELYENAVAIAKIAEISELQLAETYLAGRRIEQTADKLYNAYNTFELEKLMLRQSAGRWDETEYKRLLGVIKGRGFSRLKNPLTADPSAAKTLFEGFRKNNLDKDQVRRLANQAWADAYEM
jgi:hypothetical protein